MSSSDAPVEDGARLEPEAGEHGSRRDAVRLTTVYGGRICQFGKAYACVISDVSGGGAKVHLKDPQDFLRIAQTGEVQLIFERLSDYKALNTVVAWVKPNEHAVGLRFIDSELRRRVVLKRLMPNRWRLANDMANKQNQTVPDEAETDES